MRARQPDRDGYTTRDGVRLHWELFGEGDLTVFFLPTWSIIHSRHWKFQVPYFARHCRVLVMDGRGNGLSDRPFSHEAYADLECASDVLAVMDDTGTESAALVALSAGAPWALLVAGKHPERVRSLTFIGPGVELAPANPDREAVQKTFEVEQDDYTGWRKSNAHYWLRNHRDYLEFFFGRCFPEPHSTKQI